MSPMMQALAAGAAPVLVEGIPVEREPEGGAGYALLVILIIVGLIIFFRGGRKH